MNAQARKSLTTRQLAEALGVSDSSVKRWIDDGEIPAVRTSGGHRRITWRDAIGFIHRNRARLARPESLSLPDLPYYGAVDADTVDTLFDVFMQDDGPRARSIIVGRYLAGAEVSVIGDGLIRPALCRLGEVWHSDPDGIFLEHRAVGSCIQILSELTAWLPVPPPGASIAVTAAGPADPYLLAPLLTSLTLRERGINAVNLGPMTPQASLIRAATRYQAGLCCMSVSVTQNSRSEVDWLALSDELVQNGARLVVGGRCAPSLPAAARERLQICGSLAELGAYASGVLAGSAPLRTRQSPGARKGDHGTAS